MAAVKTRVDTRLSVVMTTGEMKNGKDVTRTISLSNIRNDAADDALLAAGRAVGALADKDLAGVKVSETYTLTEGA